MTDMMVYATKGWVKLMRSFIDSRSFDNANATAAYTHCLLRANIETKTVKGLLLQRGQFITSNSQFAEECGLTDKEMRNAFLMLESDGLIKREPLPSRANSRANTGTNGGANNRAKNGTLVTVVNYDDFGIHEVEEGEQMGKELGEQPGEQVGNSIRNRIRTKNKEKDIDNIPAIPDDHEEATKEAGPSGTSGTSSINMILKELNARGFMYTGQHNERSLIVSLLHRGYTKEQLYETADIVNESASIRQDLIQDYTAFFLSVLKDRSGGDDVDEEIPAVIRDESIPDWN